MWRAQWWSRGIERRDEFEEKGYIDIHFVEGHAFIYTFYITASQSCVLPGPLYFTYLEYRNSHMIVTVFTSYFRILKTVWDLTWHYNQCSSALEYVLININFIQIRLVSSSSISWYPFGTDKHSGYFTWQKSAAESQFLPGMLWMLGGGCSIQLKNCLEKLIERTIF